MVAPAVTGRDCGGGAITTTMQRAPPFERGGWLPRKPQLDGFLPTRTTTPPPMSWSCPTFTIDEEIARKRARVLSTHRVWSGRRRIGYGLTKSFLMRPRTYWFLMVRDRKDTRRPAWRDHDLNDTGKPLRMPVRRSHRLSPPPLVTAKLELLEHINSIAWLHRLVSLSPARSMVTAVHDRPSAATRGFVAGGS